MKIPPSNSSEFGTRLRRLRTAAGLTQTQLAERSGLSARGISDLERGLRSPRATTLNRLADGLRVPLPTLGARTGDLSSHAREPDDARASIPIPLTAFVGRNDDVSRIHTLLAEPDVRLVTITGAGGVGKTRVALQVAHVLRQRFADGVVFVDLALAEDAHLVLPTIARSVGVHHVAGREHLDRLIRALAERETLIVLDNVEHVIDAVVDLPVLLAQCPKVMILATSRERLQVSGEHEYPLSPLPVPDRTQRPSIDAFAHFDAIRLFVQRARAVSPAFALTDDNADAVAEICRLLDGLPLAIELAAARVKVLPPPALRERLKVLLPMLTGGSRDLPARQQTMRNTIAWSYDLLSSDEQRIFRQLTVFTDGFTLDAFEAVCGSLTDPELAPFEILSSLVDKHLVLARNTEPHRPRYVLLETIREFGREALANNGEEDGARNAHADWCLAFVENVVPMLRPILRPEVFDRIEAEHANLRAALTWLDHQGRSHEMMKLAAGLGWFWYISGRWHEGFGWLRRASERHGGEATPEYVQTLLSTGHLALVVRDPEARSYLERAHALAHATGDRGREVRAVILLGIMANYQGDYHHAKTRFAEANALLEELDDPWYPLVVNFQLGATAYGEGRWDDAVRTLDATKVTAEEIGDVLIPAWCTRFLTQIACEQHDIPRAAALLREGQLPGLNMGPNQTYPQYLSTAAMLADAIGEHSSTARLLGAAAVAMNDLPFPAPVQAAYERAEAIARQQLGRDSFVEMWQAGRRMGRTEIEAEIARVLAAAEDRHETSEATLLSPREQDVLRLLIDGRSNPEIADALFISTHTAARHVTNILRKFNVESRAAAVAYAFQHDLV